MICTSVLYFLIVEEWCARSERKEQSHENRAVITKAKDSWKRHQRFGRERKEKTDIKTKKKDPIGISFSAPQKKRKTLKKKELWKETTAIRNIDTHKSTITPWFGHSRL